MASNHGQVRCGPSYGLIGGIGTPSAQLCQLAGLGPPLMIAIFAKLFLRRKERRSLAASWIASSQPTVGCLDPQP